MSDESNTISKDGLRYKARIAGSPFAQTGGNATMSCAKCGMHKPRSLGSTVNWLARACLCAENAPYPRPRLPL